MKCHWNYQSFTRPDEILIYMEEFGIHEGWIIFDCSIRKCETISVVELSPVEAKIKHRQIQPINRGFNAVIEG